VLVDGYLRDLETAYQTQRLRTYPLFPGRRLVRGHARVDAMTPLQARAALDLFHELERLASVDVIQGRGWYGVRRISADLAEDVEHDNLALNGLSQVVPASDAAISHCFNRLAGKVSHGSGFGSGASFNVR